MLLFSLVLFLHITLCASFLIFSLHLFIPPPCISSTPLLLTHLITCPLKTPSLKCLHIFGMPTSTNSIAFSSNNFLMFSSFSKPVFFSQYMSSSLHSLFSSYLSLPSMAHVDTPLGFAFIFCNNCWWVFSYQCNQFLSDILPV